MPTDYAIPTLREPVPVVPGEVVLVASGDLRHTANRAGWPAQQKLEADIAARSGGARRPRAPRPRVRPRRGPRLHLEPAHGHGRLRGHPSRRAGHRGRGRLGVHATTSSPASGRTVGPSSRPPTGAASGPGLVGPAQPQRLDDQGGHGLQHHLERGLHRRLRPRRPSASGSPPGRSATTRRTCATLDAAALPAAGSRAGTRPGCPAAAATRRSWASSTKAAWACTTPSSMTST